MRRRAHCADPPGSRQLREVFLHPPPSSERGKITLVIFSKSEFCQVCCAVAQVVPGCDTTVRICSILCMFSRQRVPVSGAEVCLVLRRTRGCWLRVEVSPATCGGADGAVAPWNSCFPRSPKARDRGHPTTCGGADGAVAPWNSCFPRSPKARDRGHPTTCDGADGAGAPWDSCFPRSPKARDRGHPTTCDGADGAGAPWDSCFARSPKARDWGHPR